MALIHHRELGALFENNGGVAVLMNHGFFPTVQGQQVDPGEVRNLLIKLDELKPLRQTFKPVALAQFLGVPVNAIFSMFCRQAKGNDRYNVEIEAYAAHKMLAAFLSPKK